MKITILEGLNGSGKTSVAKGVAKELGIAESRLPYYENKTGRMLKHHIKNEKQDITELAFQTLMLENYIETLLMWIEKGDDIIITRAEASMMAYGTYFSPTDRDMLEGLSRQWLRVLDNYDLEVQRFLIDVPVDVAQSRIWKRGEAIDMFENEDIETYVHSYFKNMCNDGFLKSIDNTGDIRYTIKEVCNLIK